MQTPGEVAVEVSNAQSQRHPGVSRSLHGRKGRVRARGPAAWTFLQPDREHLLPSVAHDVKTSDRAGAPPGDLAGDFVVAVHALAVDARNEVVGAQPGAFARGAARHILNDSALQRPELQRALQSGIDVGQRRTQIAARHATVAPSNVGGWRSPR